MFSNIILHSYCIKSNLFITYFQRKKNQTSTLAYSDIDRCWYDIDFNAIQISNSITGSLQDTFLWSNYTEKFRFGIDGVWEEEKIRQIGNDII